MTSTAELLKEHSTNLTPELQAALIDDCKRIMQAHKELVMLGDTHAIRCENAGAADCLNQAIMFLDAGFSLEYTKDSLSTMTLSFAPVEYRNGYHAAYKAIEQPVSVTESATMALTSEVMQAMIDGKDPFNMPEFNDLQGDALTITEY